MKLAGLLGVVFLSMLLCSVVAIEFHTASSEVSSIDASGAELDSQVAAESEAFVDAQNFAELQSNMNQAPIKNSPLNPGGPALQPVTLDTSGQVTAVNGVPTSTQPPDVSRKLYWVSPGNGTVAMSWLVLGLFVLGMCFIGSATTALAFLCHGNKKASHDYDSV